MVANKFKNICYELDLRNSPSYDFLVEKYKIDISVYIEHCTLNSPF